MHSVETVRSVFKADLRFATLESTNLKQKIRGMRFDRCGCLQGGDAKIYLGVLLLQF